MLGLDESFDLINSIFGATSVAVTLPDDSEKSIKLLDKLKHIEVKKAWNCKACILNKGYYHTKKAGP